MWAVKASAGHSSRLKVLLVEDSELVTEQVTQLLQELPTPVEIQSAQTFDAAIAVSEQFSPDVAIVDLQLTLGSGFSVLRVLTKSIPRPRIIVLTNYGLPNYREYALLNGADHFLDKALEFELLPGIVESVAQQKALSRLSKRLDLHDDADSARHAALASKS